MIELWFEILLYLTISGVFFIMYINLGIKPVTNSLKIIKDLIISKK